MTKNYVVINIKTREIFKHTSIDNIGFSGDDK